MPLDDFGRFADPALLILISLAGDDRHGYAITQDVEQFSGVRIGPGTLYGALSRLEAQGWIMPLETVDRRQPYRLTPSGLSALGRQLSTFDRFVSAGLQRLAAR